MKSILKTMFFLLFVHAFDVCAENNDIDCPGKTKVENDACLESSIKKEDERLNSIYKSLLALSYSETYDSHVLKNGVNNQIPGKNELIKSENAWIKFRDSNCDHYYSIMYPGTQAVSDYLACKMRMTTQRADELTELYSYWSNK